MIAPPPCTCFSSFRQSVLIPILRKATHIHHLLTLEIARGKAAPASVPSSGISISVSTSDMQRKPKTNFGNLVQRSQSFEDDGPDAFSDVSDVGVLFGHAVAMARQTTPSPAFRIILTTPAVSAASSLMMAAETTTFPVWSTDAPIHAPATASERP